MKCPEKIGRIDPDKTEHKLTRYLEGISDTVLFWKTGVCGGFTTFSTFSLEAFNLFDNKQYAAGKLWE
jgi:CrcB protein